LGPNYGGFDLRPLKIPRNPALNQTGPSYDTAGTYEGLVRLRPKFFGKIEALGQNPPQSGPKCQGGVGITAYVVRPQAA
jgi:hypothetical protein